MNAAVANPETGISAAIRHAFQDSSSQDTLAILTWWESRRFFYNLIVMLSGLPSIVLYLCQGRPNFVALAFAMAAWAIGANFCYILGPSIEIALRKTGLRKYPEVAPNVFGVGLLFSVLLTVGGSFLAVFSIML